MIWGPDYGNKPDGSPKFWGPNLARMVMTYPSGDAVVEMIPESAKMNVNLASPDQIQRLVLAITNDAQRAQAVSAPIAASTCGGPPLFPLLLTTTTTSPARPTPL